MAERSIAWTTNATGDGTSGGYSAANWQNMNLKMFITNPATEGVLYGIGNNLAVTGASSPVAVNTGSALVYGIWYENDASVNVTIPTPASNPRIDRVVLRASWSAQTVRITRVAGTEAASPTAPALTQVANTTWDIPLYQVRITTGGVITLTDERTYTKHPGVYGWLNAALTVNGNITNSQSLSGSYNETVVTNTSNTAGSYARFNAKVAGGTADDPLMVWEVSGAQAWAAGMDNSDSDKFKIAPYSVIGSGDALTLDQSGNMTLLGALSASSLNASQLASGTVPIARMPTSGFDASWLTTGTLALARLSNIGTSQMAADSVDDTIVGNRVPQIYRRQGGSASDWSSAGTTSYTPAMVRMQAGTFSVPASSSPTAVTFPVAFSQPPVVIATGQGDTNIITISSITSSGFSILARERGGNYNGATACWIAIGTE